MRLDHLVLATPDPESTVSELAAATGVTPAAGGSHVGLGTRNWLAALATNDADDRAYLELIGPDPEQPDPETPRPFGIDELRGPAFVWWCARSERISDLDSLTQSLRGVEYSEPIEMRRRAPDGELVWMLSFPSDLDGAIPFVIDWLDSPHPSASAPGGLRFDEMRIHSPSPAELSSRLGVLGPFPIDVVQAPVLAVHATLTGPDGAYELRSSGAPPA